MMGAPPPFAWTGEELRLARSSAPSVREGERPVRCAQVQPQGKSPGVLRHLLSFSLVCTVALARA